MAAYRGNAEGAGGDHVEAGEDRLDQCDADGHAVVDRRSGGGYRIDGTEHRRLGCAGLFTQWGHIAEERGLAVLPMGGANAESVLAQNPDLIVVSATGGDSVVDLYEQFTAIAPTIVVDYGGSSWQEVAAVLGKATGLEDNAAATVAKFDSAVEAAKAKITLPRSRPLRWSTTRTAAAPISGRTSRGRRSCSRRWVSRSPTFPSPRRAVNPWVSARTSFRSRRRTSTTVSRATP
ncbi:ABC transporter substrate-binding protein [Rhodococcus sp. 3Y1]